MPHLRGSELPMRASRRRGVVMIVPNPNGRIDAASRDANGAELLRDRQHSTLVRGCGRLIRRRVQEIHNRLSIEADRGGLWFGHRLCMRKGASCLLLRHLAGDAVTIRARSQRRWRIPPVRPDRDLRSRPIQYCHHRAHRRRESQLCKPGALFRFLTSGRVFRIRSANRRDAHDRLSRV